jgi:hypothetical protein
LQKEDLINQIKKYLPSNYSVSIKNKNNYLVYVKKKIFSNEVNIHPVFLKADKNLLTDIVDFILKRNKNELKNSKKRLSDFFHENQQSKKVKINTKFKNKDINKMFSFVLNELKIKFINIDFSKIEITWGRLTSKRTRSIRFGSFDKKKNIVRLHPVLDNQNIPDFFINSIIYHEVSHFIVFESDKNAKSHDRNFYKMLKNIDPFFIQSKNWEKENKMIFFNLK